MATFSRPPKRKCSNYQRLKEIRSGKLRLVVAAAAFMVAWRSLSAQKSIARKRAAIDVFLKTEMDHNMIEAFSAYESAVDELEKGDSAEVFYKDNRRSYNAIRTYLNINELIAIGVNRKVFDEGVCFNFWSDLLIDVGKGSAKIIENDRKEEGDEEAYSDMLKLAKKWTKRIERSKGYRNRIRFLCR